MKLLKQIRIACADTGILYEKGPRYFIRNKWKEREYLKAIRLYNKFIREDYLGVKNANKN